MKILIPTDFCQLSVFAYDLAFKIDPHAEVHFVHVVHLAQEDETFEGRDFDSQLAALESQMQEFIKDSKAEGHILKGRMTEQILKLEDELNIDLVLLGNESREGWQEILSSNENTLLARQGQAPVLSLMCDRSDMDMHEIAFFHDFMDQVEVDLSLLKAIQSLNHATLNLVYVTRDSKVDIQGQISEFIATHALENVKIHTHSSSSVEKGIMEFLQEKHMDLVSIGIFSKRTLASRFLGSIVEFLHNHLHKPILTLKMKEK